MQLSVTRSFLVLISTLRGVSWSRDHTTTTLCFSRRYFGVSGVGFSQIGAWSTRAPEREFQVRMAHRSLLLI